MTIAAHTSGLGRQPRVWAPAGVEGEIETGATVRRLPGLATAAAASLGAGAIHAAAIGIHAEHPQLARVFVATAVLQLTFGLMALLRQSRAVAFALAAVNAAAVVGWVVTRTNGVSWIDGLEVAERPQLADTFCALLGVAAAGTALAGALIGWHLARPPRVMFPALFVAALTIPAMVGAGTHVHDEGDAAHAHDEASAAVAPVGNAVIDESVPHAHDDSAAATPAVVDASATNDPASDGDGGAVVDPAANTDGTDNTDDTDDTVATAATDEATTTTHAHIDTAAAPVPYDPTKPIDLSGVPGVTPQQQAAAENIIAVTLAGLPQWADPAVAESAGFRSIGDGGTGVEHFVNSVNMEDEETFDPDFPESLVYDTSDGGRRLVAAMYMLKRGTPLADAPNIGGSLMQWHTHNNLCYNDQGKVAGLTDAAGNCPAGLVKPVETPMIHVWIESHPCGPFAALEGIGGGVIPEGEERLCDHAHGA